MLRRAQDICLSAEERAEKAEARLEKIQAQAARLEIELKESRAEAKRLANELKVNLPSFKPLRTGAGSSHWSDSRLSKSDVKTPGSAVLDATMVLMCRTFPFQSMALLDRRRCLHGSASALKGFHCVVHCLHACWRCHCSHTTLKSEQKARAGQPQSTRLSDNAAFGTLP